MKCTTDGQKQHGFGNVFVKFAGSQRPCGVPGGIRIDAAAGTGREFDSLCRGASRSIWPLSIGLSSILF
jgi:hypothetical protein